MILVVDPGIRGCGVALFYGGQGNLSTLHRADYVSNPSRYDNGPEECRAMAREVREWAEHHVACPTGKRRVDGLVCEWPRIYTAAKLKGDPNDLPPLVGVDCALAAYYDTVPVKRYFPEEWKGQLSKGQSHFRVLGRLSEAEKCRIGDAGVLSHNTRDAIGIGLHHLGRLVRRRIIARE